MLRDKDFADHVLAHDVINDQPWNLVSTFNRTAFSLARHVVMPISQRTDATDTACYFTIWRDDRIGGFYSLGSLAIDLHTVSQTKADKYFTFANEKCSRLARHPGHLLSHESRIDEQSQYPGAVRLSPRFGLSLAASGLRWECDELLCYLVAYNFGFLSLAEVWQRIALSDNQLAATHFRAMHLPPP